MTTEKVIASRQTCCDREIIYSNCPICGKDILIEYIYGTEYDDPIELINKCEHFIDYIYDYQQVILRFTEGKRK